jgi:hypothetical protein
MGEFQSLSEVDETSILKLGLPAPLRLFSQLVTAHSGRRPIGTCIPRSGLLRSDFVHWPTEPTTRRSVSGQFDPEKSSAPSILIAVRLLRDRGHTISLVPGLRKSFSRRRLPRRVPDAGGNA